MRERKRERRERLKMKEFIQHCKDFTWLWIHVFYFNIDILLAKNSSCINSVEFAQGRWKIGLVIFTLCSARVWQLAGWKSHLSRNPYHYPIKLCSIDTAFINGDGKNTKHTIKISKLLWCLPCVMILACLGAFCWVTLQALYKFCNTWSRKWRMNDGLVNFVLPCIIKYMLCVAVWLFDMKIILGKLNENFIVDQYFW